MNDHLKINKPPLHTC